jgi:hypothetical protein
MWSCARLGFNVDNVLQHAKALLLIMRIAIGADHGGYPLNERVMRELQEAETRLSILARTLARGLTTIRTTR